jgi:hypothetical protein
MKAIKLKKLNPCSEALKWVQKQDSNQQAWNDCKRGDWMLWLIGKLSGEPKSKTRKKLVLAACECARLSLELIPENEKRSLIAIEIAEKWTRGESSIEDVKNAADAAGIVYAAGTVYATNAAYVAANATYTDTAVYYVNRYSILKQCADIVRKHYPKVPKL